MQTTFTLAQLADPNTAEAEKILRTCVHCGFCTATCPTYVLLGDELDSPRGRIYLIKDMLENGRAADERTVRHVDRCLSCLACMTTCPSGVDYMHLVDHARAHIEATWRRPWRDRLLRGRGYREIWTSWVLEVPAATPIEPQSLPPGYELRTFVPGRDEDIAYRLIEDAFNEWPDRTPQTYADWQPRILGRRGFEPWQVRFAVDGDRTPVAVACTILDVADCAHVDQIAVRADRRGLGLARALLVDAFENGRVRGAIRSDLSTDSRTGALGLYLRVGMTITQTWHHLGLDL